MHDTGVSIVNKRSEMDVPTVYTILPKRRRCPDTVGFIKRTTTTVTGCLVAKTTSRLWPRSMDLNRT